MAEVLSILSSLHASGQALHSVAKQTHPWRRLSDRLFDLRESLDTIELTLEGWRYKYDIQVKKPPHYLEVLFGRQGCKKLQELLISIDATVDALKKDVHSVIGQAFKVKSIRTSQDHMDSSTRDDLLQDCLARIRQRKSWSNNFHLSVLRRSEDLECHLDWLHTQLATLERLSELYVEKEHPERFHRVKRLPGRRVVQKEITDRRDSVQSRLLDALAARKDAELLYRAAGRSNGVHIGLSVPQIHKRDFAFLLNLGGKTHEVLVHPVKIKAINDPRRIQTDFSGAIPILTESLGAACYMLPSSSTSAGFQVSIPPANLLSDLESKDALSTIIRRNTDSHFLGSQILYAHDQSAIASGIAQACFRLIGSEWLDSLDCINLRWRRTKEGKWTSMLTADLSGTITGATDQTLEQCIQENLRSRERRDLSKHVQIFRIGLVLVELALRMPISHVSYDASSLGVKIFMPASSSASSSQSLSSSYLSPSASSNLAEEVSALSLAAEIERRTNIHLAGMAYFCLSTLQDSAAMADQSIAAGYFQHVLRDAEALAELVREEGRGRSPAQSGFSTPLSSGGGLGTPLSATAGGLSTPLSARDPRLGVRDVFWRVE